MVPDEQSKIERFLHGKLVEFVHSPLSTSSSLHSTEHHRKLADEVNAELLKKFDCVEDYKIVTLISALYPEQKAGGVCNAALWSEDTDLVISAHHTRDSQLYTISAHFIKITGEDTSGSESD